MLMKRLVKIMAGILLGIIVVILIGYAVIVSYKKEILSELNQQINESINGQMQIGDLEITLIYDFPNLSLFLKDVYVRGPRYNQYKTDFLTAEAIALNVRPFMLLQKKVGIKSIDILNGDVSIFRTKNNYINLDILKSPDTTSTNTNQPTSSQSLSLSFDKIYFENVYVAYYDSLKGKSFAATFGLVDNTVISTDSSLQCNILGDIDFEGLLFNSAKGSFL